MHARNDKTPTEKNPPFSQLLKQKVQNHASVGAAIGLLFGLANRPLMRRQQGLHQAWMRVNPDLPLIKFPILQSTLGFASVGAMTGTVSAGISTLRKNSFFSPAANKTTQTDKPFQWLRKGSGR